MHAYCSMEPAEKANNEYIIRIKQKSTVSYYPIKCKLIITITFCFVESIQ
jgi:hypothetical protein